MKQLKKQIDKKEEVEDLKNNKQKLINEQANIDKKIKEYKK